MSSEVVGRAAETLRLMEAFLAKVRVEGSDGRITPEELVELTKTAEEMGKTFQLFISELASEADILAEPSDTYEYLEAAVSTIYACRALLRPAVKQLAATAKKIALVDAEVTDGQRLPGFVNKAEQEERIQHIFGDERPPGWGKEVEEAVDRAEMLRIPGALYDVDGFRITVGCTVQQLNIVGAGGAKQINASKKGKVLAVGRTRAEVQFADRTKFYNFRPTNEPQTDKVAAQYLRVIPDEQS